MVDKILLGVTQQDYEFDQEILDLIVFVEIKVINDVNLAKLAKHNKLISFHLQRFYEFNPQPSTNIFLKYWTSRRAQKILQDYLTRTLCYSSHIYSATEKWESFGQSLHSVALTKIFDRDFLLKKMVSNMTTFKNTLKKPYLLEAMDYNSYETAKGLYEYICQPDFIKELLTKTGCGFLLDLSHARVSAKNLGYNNYIDYIDLLPLEKVVEIHLSRPEIKPDIAYDRHLPVTDEEIDIILSLRSRLKNLCLINLEIFREKPIIVNQLKMLRQKLINRL